MENGIQTLNWHMKVQRDSFIKNNIFLLVPTERDREKEPQKRQSLFLRSKRK